MKAISRRLLIAGGAVAIALALSAGGCSTDPAPVTGDDIANNRQNYAPANDVEGNNYNARQRLADQPATLIWCTAFPTSPNAKAFTVPIVGKLTSGNKRPYATTRTIIDGDTAGMEYEPEKAGPDGMFGSSGEYRYGFDPAGNYHDFYNLETYCTTVPNVVQKEQTTIIVRSDTDLTSLDRQIEAALKTCRDRDKAPDKTCPEAARLTGGA